MLLDLRRRVFTHVQRLPLSFHERYTSGRTICRLTSDVDALAELLDEGLDDLVTALFSVLAIGVVLLVLDPPLGVVALLGFPPLFWLARLVPAQLVGGLPAHPGDDRRADRPLRRVARRHPRGAGVPPRAAQRRASRGLNDDYRLAHHRAFWLIAIFVPGVKLIGNMVTIAVLAYGALRVMDGDLAVGVLAAFLLYLRRFFDPMQDVAMFYNTYQSATAALEKLSGVLEERPGRRRAGRPGAAAATPRGELAFDGVRFGYTGRDRAAPARPARSPPGRRWRWSARPAPGKSTLARLAARFYDPIEGEVRLDGVALRRLTDADLRRAVVMVTQESFLFSGTIADNIAFGRPGRLAGRDRGGRPGDRRARVHRGAARGLRHRRPQARRAAVGRAAPAGGFARAFLADPAVLILDEATCSLDIPSERLVQHALRTILADRTALIIAHRLSTVEIADRVLVMEDGRIVEDGTPAELVGGVGRFADLHRAWADSLV